MLDNPKWPRKATPTRVLALVDRHQVGPLQDYYNASPSGKLQFSVGGVGLPRNALGHQSKAGRLPRSTRLISYLTISSPHAAAGSRNSCSVCTSPSVVKASARRLVSRYLYAKAQGKVRCENNPHPQMIKSILNSTPITTLLVIIAEARFPPILP